MPRTPSDQLHALIHSMNKNEKRYFKLAMGSISGKEEKKVMRLFDALNENIKYDEKRILQQVSDLKQNQMPNLKGYLQDKLLQSLRQFNSSTNADIQIREQIDYASLLFQRRLFKAGMLCLKKAKRLAEAYEKLELLLEIIRLEKTVVLDTIDQENLSKVDVIITEVQKINAQINNINIFTNLSLKLEYHFTKIGSVRNEKDFLSIQQFFVSNLPNVNEEDLSIHEQIHLYNLYVAYYHYIQDYESNFMYAYKLNKLFQIHPKLRGYRVESFIKSLNTLLVAQYRLFKYHEFVNTLDVLKMRLSDPVVYGNENLKVRVMKYVYLHEVNLYFMRGDFSAGIEKLENAYQIEDFLKITDRHSQLIFCYKIACLYFGAGKFSMATKWLQKIINETHSEIGEDLHCFARIINLISHYELENFEVINYYIISTYRFLLKKEDLHQFQKSIIQFLRKLGRNVSRKELDGMFAELKVQLLPLLDSRFDGRAFYYFDIISWLESKIEKIPVEAIVQKKFAEKLAGV